MKPPGADRVVVRDGDINTKSEPVRHAMEQRLIENVSALLDARGIPGDVEYRRTRPLIHTDESSVEAAADAATDAFGVVSVSPARRVDPDRDSIVDALAETARACYDGGTFAVSARRAYKGHPYTSQELGEVGGAAIGDAVADDFEPAVDLDDPDLTFFVEAREDVAFVFLEKRPGPGGLPLGSQAPLVALVSGGIDSPVAAYEAMRRGSPIVPIYARLGDYGGPDHEARAMETVRRLAEYAPNYDLRPYVLDVGETLSVLAARTNEGRMLAFRRLVFRAAEEIARLEDAKGIVTGEAIGQKSSQTTTNLAVTDPATTFPIHRPLLTWDKPDIEQQAREIGTYDDSTIPAGCNRFAPEQPLTAASLDGQRVREPDDLFDRAERIARDAERVPLEPTPTAI
ncbi:MAG: tRNA sulfurtransferase [Halolamina sp.]